MSDINGTGMAEAPNPEASGAERIKPTRRNASQGKLRSGVMDQRTIKIDTNKHGIRRETTVPPNKKTGRPKKV
jgi:hypothetical protein